jgi:hypothetical protein
VIGLILLLAAASAQAPTPVLLPRAYAHNDYLHPRPLFDALDRGFSGVEADVYLRGGELRIGHMPWDPKPGRTLQTLYLDPLLKLVRQNGGTVFPGGPKGFLLMVEFKSNGEKSYSVLCDILKQYQEMLTTFTPDSADQGAVTLVITGHRPKDVLSKEKLRYAAIDGDLGDLDKADKTLFPVISASWSSRFQWRNGPMDSLEKTRLRNDIAKAHAHGRKIRYYAIPDREETWEVLNNAGVDLINTDKLEKLKDFLLKHQTVIGRKPAPLAPAAGGLTWPAADPFQEGRSPSPS